ncbi:hypothetical protein OEA41_007394 [Lepraria neglecta]|uniref:Uncharacterized protein n=1 Tax=Lepraria neglecta TaxID=209136 RepID=A0AAD9ZD16_9LECA|nr:hypothetical protein OEA41_007394 [Lepraria neglecta]
MGLGGFKNSWQRQSKDFGHGQNTNRDQSTKYSCLVFDNRGVGESDKPLARIPKSKDVELTNLKARIFSQAWLDEPDAEGHFPTNGDRFAAQELKKRQDTDGYTRTGFICQAIAAGWHHKSPKQLEELGDKVGRERIQVVHGTLDRMITPLHGDLLFERLGGKEKGVTMVVVEGKSHGLAMEWRRDFTKLIGGFVEKTGVF